MKCEVAYEVHLESKDLTFPPDFDRLLALVGRETVEYLASYTGKRRPPIRAGGPERPAHPGGWADITHVLVNSYGYRVDPKEMRLDIFNTAEYAKFLENREGFYVLRGVMQRGGIVERFLRDAISTLYPSWKVEFSK